MHAHPPSTLADPTRPLHRRRLLLAAALAGLPPLSACGGGGGTDTAPAPPPSPARPGGRLIYRSSTGVGLFDLTLGQERVFAPDSRPFLDPGLGLSPAGLLSVALEGGGGTDFRLGFHTLDGASTRVLGVSRDTSFQTSAVVWNARGDRFALSIDEPVSALDGTRIARTLVVAWPAATVIATLDRWEAPEWAGDELLLREPGGPRLRRLDAALQDQGWLEPVRVNPVRGACSASRDGQLLVWQDGADGRRVLALDRPSGRTWVAARDEVSDLHAPVLSPDGRHLAVQTRGSVFVQPHVLPFGVGVTVVVDSAVHVLAAAMANPGGRMAWSA